MKIRYMAILYTAILFGIAVFMFHNVSAMSYQTVDMVEINERYKTIEQQLQLVLEGQENIGTRNSDSCQKALSQLEQQEECTILLRSDEDYQRRLNAALIENAIILDYEVDGQIVAKICLDGQSKIFEAKKQNLRRAVVMLTVAVWLAGMGLLLYLYLHYIRPFAELRQFAGEVARGNLDMPLSMTKQNYFGAFTESFDIMREELKRARENEYRANVSKKELVAELSHDVKTPVATIKAACELLQIKEKNQDVLEKVELIENKANMIDQLIGNMFQATLEELEVLKVEPTEEASTRIEEMFLQLKGYGNLYLTNHVPECLVIMDALRMNQAIDNLVNNAFKYAGTAIYVSFWEDAAGIGIRVRDEGAGVPEDELTKITEKFYRGSNAAKECGSGLGLYLAKLFMDKMQGQMNFYNDNGFVVELYIRKV